MSAAPPVGVVVALAREARIVDACLRRSRVAADVALCQAGIGPSAACQAARQLRAGGARLLLSVGFAGGLAAPFRSGDLLLPAQVMAEDGRRFAAWEHGHARVRERLGGGSEVHTQTLVSSARVIASVDGKRALAASSGAVAVDMESAAVAAVASASAVPFLALRVVSDTAEQPLPAAALGAVRADGSESVAAVLRGLARRPFEAPALLRLARGTRAAQRSLDHALAIALPALCELFGE